MATFEFDSTPQGEPRCLIVITDSIEAEALDAPIGVARFHTSQPWKQRAACWCGQEHAASWGADMTVFVGPVDSNLNAAEGSFAIWIVPAGSDIENVTGSVIVASDSQNFGRWARSVLVSMLSMIWVPGLICLDFADVTSILGGRQRIEYHVRLVETDLKSAAKAMVVSPTFATGENYLVSIRGSTAMTLLEVADACHVIGDVLGPNVNVVMGASIDESATQDEIAIFSGIEREPQTGAMTP